MGCTALTSITYHGTESEFSAIDIGSDNDRFTANIVTYKSDS